jgi:demethylmenaquinone methyltransferase/2-methoxy-6-polyprenyl-1,4-benzoquinol methylase
MSGSYEVVNHITSFGFSRRWRQQCVEQIRLANGMRAYDLMTGMGEGWVYIVKGVGPTGKIVAMDISPNMLKHAQTQREKLAEYDIEIVEGNVLENGFADNSADCVISLFGVKTLSDEQKAQFAREIKRILKPEGQYSLIEVSVPQNGLLRMLYMFYLKYGIPLIGKLVLGNPENYRMLGIYTEAFGNCHGLRGILSTAGLNAQYVEYFFGCASGVWGRKLEPAAIVA